MNGLEPGDPLWKLLGHASKAEPSAFFAAKVAREARRLGDAPEGWLVRLRALLAPRPVLATVGTFAAAAVLALLSLPSVSPWGRGTASQATLAEGAESFDPASELAAVEYLGQLMAVADPGQLEDYVLADLFF
jgi:hypothetical protein